MTPTPPRLTGSGTQPGSATEPGPARPPSAHDELEALRTLVAQGADVVWRCDPHPRPLSISGSLEAALGYAASDVVAAEALLSPRSNERLRVLALEGGAGDRRVELEWRRKDGAVATLAFSIRALLGGDGAVSGLVGAVIPTPSAESLDNEAQRRYELLVENASEGVVVICGDRIVFANAAIERLTGLGRDELQRRPFTEIALPDDPTSDGRCPTRESPGARQTLRILRADGQKRWVEMHAAAVTWDCRPAQLLFARDITEHKLAEQRLADALATQEQRVREHTAQLEAANEQLRREIGERKRTERALVRADRLTALGTLAGGVAHEFNNIHQIISGWTRLLLESPHLSDQDRDAINRVLRASKRGGQVAENLLRFSRSDTNRRGPASLTAVAQDVLALVQKEYESEGISFQLGLREVPPTNLDADQIAQVVMSLLINARHALLGRERKAICVESGSDGERVYLAIADTGCGIAAEDLSRIFTPFYTTKGEYAAAGSAQAQVKGTGLGLSVSQTIVGDHGGELTVESTLGTGSRFVVSIPVRAETAAREAPEAAEQGRVDGKRILVVEDEPDVSQLAVVMLRRAGAIVQASADGAEALERIQVQPFDLLLVDLQMPVMGGDDFLRHLAAVPVLERPRVVVMTGRRATEEEAAGADRVLRKPFSSSDLLGAVGAALARR